MIYNCIFLSCFIVSFFYIKEQIILIVVIVYALYLFYELLWICFGKFNWILNNDHFIVKKNLLSFPISSKKYLLYNVEKANLIRDVNSDKKVGFQGMLFNLKYDYAIELILKNQTKKQLFDIKNEYYANKILEFINTNKT